MSLFTLLHTSDWHIGQNLHGRKRYEEGKAFLDWLLEQVMQQSVHALLVAGDVFDTPAPSNRAQKLYYDFLGKLSRTACRHVVIVGGNHDSPTFLNAPADLLRQFRVSVLGESLDSPADEVLVLRSPEGVPELMVCAVPYLRDRAIAQSEAEDSPGDMDRQRVRGICRHYEAVLAAAREQRAGLEVPVPLVVMGHLFTAGGLVAADEGVRNLYVGSLGAVPADIFPPDADYVALGHLHSPQMVAKNPCWLYSGSPLPMSFSEAQREKSVVLVRFDGVTPQIEKLSVPVFQEMVRLEGDWETLSASLEALKERDSRALVDVHYTGQALMSDLNEKVAELTRGSGLDVLRVRNSRSIAAALARAGATETLQDMTEEAVFERCLEQNSVPEDQREPLRRTYREAVRAVHEQDLKAQ